MNWKKEPLGKICKTTSGGTPSRKNQSYYQNGTIPWVKSGELENNIITTSEEFITEEGLLNSSAKIFPAGTLLIALYGATIGKLAFLGIDAATNQAVCGVFQNENVSLKYLYYYLLFQRPNLIKQGVGGAQPNISQTILKKLEISYPDSITEQQRIVARIEELFSELDKAVDTLKTTKEQLEVYRQAVMKDAFQEKESIIRLGDAIEKPHYGTSKKCDYPCTANSTAVLRIPNIDTKNGRVDSSDLKYAEFNEKELEQLSLKNGDILIIRSNGSISLVGSSAIIRKCDTDKTYAGYLMRLRILNKEKLLPQYLLYYLSSPDARRYIESVAKSTSGVNNINSQEISKLCVPLSSIEKQEKTVAEIEMKLSVYHEIEKSVDTVLVQADAMRQSILKQAFEGAL